MPGDAISATPEQWLEVGRRVRQRRVELGLGQDDLVASRSVVSNLEADPPRQETFAVASLVKIARALGWSPDSIERVIGGKEPIDAGATLARGRILPPEWEERWEALENLVAELREEQRRDREELQAEIDRLKAGQPTEPADFDLHPSLFPDPEADEPEEGTSNSA